MNWPPFEEFFHKATGNNSPYDYQRRLACLEQNGRPEAEWLASGTPCQSQLINIPTGLGKTAAVVLAWVWNRVHRQNPQWPRRLVYCLPMRTLVEQTQEEVQKWLHNLLGKSTELNIPEQSIADLKWLVEHSPVILMGGEELDATKREWDIHPERPAILIGTQDMLLSRALNRGYGMSRYRWPMHFGLLNNDCLWVMDETQLMGVGVETSAQLDGFRHNGKMQTFGACPTWWMSATLDDARLATVDHPKPVGGWPVITLSEAEKSGGRPHDLITAPKKLSSVLPKLSPDTKDYAEQLARLVRERHQADTLTLVVVNRVKRAREVFEALTKGKAPLYPPEKVALIHSRFRPVDRKRHTKLLFDKDDRIVIATQAVEAGVDVSARLLITELAPWPSLVQRMGRCNRRADIPGAEVLWVNIQPDTKGELLLPYSANELAKARDALLKITNGDGDVSPKALAKIKVDPEPVIRPVIRRRDLVDLFDTTPDICGQDLDISRYIRDGEDNDVQFFWREIATDSTPARDDKPPQRNELCRVSIGDASKLFAKKTTRAWRWNPLERKWEKAEKPHPGGVYLLATTSGGYYDDLGWTGDSKHQPMPHSPEIGVTEAHDDEPDTFSHSWQTISEHTRLVVEQTTVLTALVNEAKFADALRIAALWHDIGKAHQEFQKMLRNGDSTKEGQLWAKSADKDGKCTRYGFRHELASALAWLLTTPADVSEGDLVAYLIAAHHGKVRLSIRSLPDEPEPDLPPMPDGTERLFARGIWHQHKDDAEKHDVLPTVDLGGLKTPEIPLDLSFMKMGEGPYGPSWLARMVALRDRLGPFCLAYLETLLRAADARASRKPTD